MDYSHILVSMFVSVHGGRPLPPRPQSCPAMYVCPAWTKSNIHVFAFSGWLRKLKPLEGEEAESGFCARYFDGEASQMEDHTYHVLFEVY